MRPLARTLALLLVVPLFAVPVYTFTASFFPIKCSYSDIARILAAVDEYVMRSNGASPQATIEITATRGHQSVRASTVSEFRRSAEVLPVLYELHYNYSCYKCPTITAVRIDLDDFRRRLSVEGPSQAHADALFAMLTRTLNDHQVYFGGSTLRAMAGALLMVTGLIVMLVGILESRTIRWRAIWGIGGALVALSVFAVSWETLLPGTSIYAANPSLIVRYSAEISLAGAILTVVTFGISIWYARRSEQRRPKNLRHEKPGA